MPEREAFTAGVRPGGLTTSTEIRLLLCYLVQHSGPVTQQQLETALMDAQLVNYFEIGSGLDDIRRQGLVACSKGEMVEEGRELIDVEEDAS